MTLLVHLSSDCRSHHRNCWTIRSDYQPRNRLCECNDILTRWCNIDITACITSVSLTHWPLSYLNRISDQVNFKLNIMIGGRSISCALPLRWMPVDLTDYELKLSQLMAWCRHAASNYLKQCWSRSISPYGVARPQWVKVSDSRSIFVKWF